MSSKDYWHELKTMNRVSNERDFPELDLLDEYLDISQDVPIAEHVRKSVAKGSIPIGETDEHKPIIKNETGAPDDAPATKMTIEQATEGSEENDETEKTVEQEPASSRVVEELQAEIRVLQEEMKQLRNRIEDNSYDIYVVPKSGQGDTPPRLLAAGVEPSNEGLIPVTKSIEISQPQGTAAKSTADAEPPKKKYAWIGEVVFYLFLILIIASAILIKSNSGGRPITIAGYSAFTVLTSSMESEYPKGSLVVVKETDPKLLVIGDDITFMISETSSVTHRIVGIQENFQGTGQRGFETKGVMNPLPDNEIVAATNVVGKVVFHSKIIGQIGGFINKNWPFLIFAAVVLFGLSAYLKWNFRQIDEEEAKKKTAAA